MRVEDRGIGLAVDMEDGDEAVVTENFIRAGDDLSIG
jgi:hypothetical protein